MDAKATCRADTTHDITRRADLSAARCDKSAINAVRQQYVSAEHVSLDANCEVIGSQAPGRSVWLIRSGLLRMQRFAFDGRRQILSLSLPGEIVGYDRPWREGLSVESATACNLCRIDRREFEAQLEVDPDLRKNFHRQQHIHLERLRWLTWSIGALRPEERLSAFLALSTRFMPYLPMPDGSAMLTMMLARSDIADLLATTMETISRITHSLEETGVIQIQDPSHFRVLDLSELNELGRIDAAFDNILFRPKRTWDHRFVNTSACAHCPVKTAC